MNECVVEIFQSDISIGHISLKLRKRTAPATAANGKNIKERYSGTAEIDGTAFCKLLC
jgi:hypothetical protein